MTHCTFITPDGNRCPETGAGKDGFCKWHSRIPVTPDIAPDHVKAELEHKVREGKSLAGFNLKRADLRRACLIGADLRHADLSHADLSLAHMYGADLKNANLFKANLGSANMKNTDLRNANLLAAVLDGTRIENVQWDDGHILINEREAEKAGRAGDREAAMEKYKEAEEIYRNIKLACRMIGHSKDQSPFFYREMVVHRKQMPLFSIQRLAHKLMDLVTGYGEKPLNVLAASLFVVMVSAVFYGIFGVLYQGDPLSFQHHDMSLAAVMGNLIYFSSVVFTTIGFGDILPSGISKWIMTVEGFLGQILIAFLVVCIYKKLMER